MHITYRFVKPIDIRLALQAVEAILSVLTLVSNLWEFHNKYSPTDYVDHLKVQDNTYLMTQNSTASTAGFLVDDDLAHSCTLCSVQIHRNALCKNILE